MQSTSVTSRTSFWGRINPLVATLMMLATAVPAVRLYYHIKPAIPRYVRYVLRQKLAERLRKVHVSTWPILRTAGQQPAGWRGWPHQHAFAFVLTHDVESSTGLDRVKALAELELSLGFRSSFNFIPEGSYSVPRSLRHWLTDRGFEVGVHDHRHDGKLYDSFRGFSSSARKINQFLRDWNAVGFRSGFMLHNLDWIPQLDVLYDASTFDTDPFEPQSDGAQTIFPFSLRAANGREIVELPYTLPQDSTLFLLLRERTNDIWKEKLSWIAASGGMALLNVHPDYLSFGRPHARYEYSADLYGNFLQHARQQYEGRFWSALPKQVAAFHRQTVHPGLKPLSV